MTGARGTTALPPRMRSAQSMLHALKFMESGLSYGKSLRLQGQRFNQRPKSLIRDTKDGLGTSGATPSVSP